MSFHFQSVFFLLARKKRKVLKVQKVCLGKNGPKSPYHEEKYLRSFTLEHLLIGCHFLDESFAIVV